MMKDYFSYLCSRSIPATGILDSLTSPLCCSGIGKTNLIVTLNCLLVQLGVKLHTGYTSDQGYREFRAYSTKAMLCYI